ncbi:hypothetical protein CTA1_244 [Colletotrichum tanaceti]|uniref:Uncharacterized protein n=1 Tax=Colletotrichum tanaceti TaxID=1306861 RepID=A0A4U6X3H1_9PEZI|nr:hypothetical protein CTA1_244 [Colletotrichum tanaceti]
MALTFFFRAPSRKVISLPFHSAALPSTVTAFSSRPSVTLSLTLTSAGAPLSKPKTVVTGPAFSSSRMSRVDGRSPFRRGDPTAARPSVSRIGTANCDGWRNVLAPLLRSQTPPRRSCWFELRTTPPLIHLMEDHRCAISDLRVGRIHIRSGNPNPVRGVYVAPEDVA